MTVYSSGGGGSFRTPTQITALHQQSLNQELILGANPWLADDPETLFQLSTSGADPEDLVHNAGALAGMDSIERLQGSLSRLNDVAARSVYGKLTEQQQRALNDMGYAPPESSGGGGLISGAWDLAGDVVGTAFKPVSTIATPIIGGALDLLTWIGDVPAHFYRAIRQMEGWQQWLALGAAVGAVALTGGLALGAGAGMIGAGGALGALGGGAASLLGGAAGMGSLATLGTVGAIGLGGAVLGTMPTAIQNPTEWWDMMNPFGARGVGRGEKIFTMQGQEKAREILGGAEHLHALARDIGAEIDVTDLAYDLAGERDAMKQNTLIAGIERAARKLADPGTQEYQAIFGGLNNLLLQPEFLDAVDALASSKISFGRDVAGAFGLEQGDFGHGFISGAADGLWLFTMDPTLAVGKIGKLQRFVRRGVEIPSGPEAIQNLTRMVREDAAVGSVVDQVARAVTEENFSLMPRAWRSMFQPLMEYKTGEYLQHGLPALDNFSREDFLKFIEHGDGLKRITEGKATIRGVEQIIVSTQNQSAGWGKFVNELKNVKYGLTDVTFEDDLYRTAKRFGAEVELDSKLPRNFMSESVDAGFMTRGVDQVPINETWGYKTGDAIGTGLLYVPGGRSLGNFIAGITTMTPPGSAIALTGEEAADHIPRFVETMGQHFNMPSEFRREWLDTIMRQGTVGQRRQALYSYMDSVMTAGGMRNTDELSRFADEFLSKYKQAYAYGGLDEVRVGNMNRLVGHLPQSHGAVYMVMPNLRDMSKIVRQGHIIKNIARVTDQNFAEQLMSRVIKPGWLLRIGFIPRAAGEEMLAFWLRMSEGGLVQEFAGRTVGKRVAHKKALARLDEVGGKKELLTKDELRALDPSAWLPAHLRPLVAMKERHGWLDPDTGMLSNWIDATTRWREDGIIPMLSRQDRDSFPSWLSDPKNPFRSIILGKEGSIREMALMGVDPDYVRAGELWMNRHADSIMRATSSLNSGMMEKAYVNPDSTSMFVPDPKNPGEKKEILVVMNGERGRIAAGDERYLNAVHHRIGEVFYDDPVAPIYSHHLTNYFPGFDEISLENVAEALEAISEADAYTIKMLVGELLQPRLDNWKATAQNVGRNQGHIEEIMRIAADTDNGVPSIETLQTTIEQWLARAKVEKLDAEIIGQVEKLTGKLEKMRPVLEGMDALGPDARAWTSAVLTRQMASDGTAYNVNHVWRQAQGGDELLGAPDLVYYRGIRDMHNTRINPDGSITFMATKQDQWKNSGAKAISLSIDPGQSMTYATDRSTRLTERLDGGVIIEMDGNWVNQQFNTTLDELRTKPTNYGFANAPEEDSLTLIGGMDDEFTEVAIAMRTDLHGNVEFTIPAGKWRIQNTDDARYVSEMAAEGRQKFRGMADVIYDIKGEPVADLVPAVDSRIDAFLESLTDEERAWLDELMDDQLASMKQYAAELLNEEHLKPATIFDLDEMPTGSGDFSDSLIMKWRSLVDDKIQGEATVGDVFRALDNDQANLHEFGLDDMIRERLGKELIQSYDPMRPKNPLNDNWQKSQHNLAIRETWGLRGQGGWGDMAEMQGWAPFHTDFESFQRALQSDLTAALQRPENAEYVKRSDRLLNGRNGEAVARPVQDGEARLYTPVVPSNSRHVDELLDTLDFGDDLPDFVRAEINAVDSNLAKGDDLYLPASPNIKTEITGNDMAGRVAYWRAQGDIDAAVIGDVSTARANAARAVQDKMIADENGVATLLPGFHEAWDDYKRIIGMDLPLERKAEQLLARVRPWHYSDELIRNLSDEEKKEILVRALKAYDASRAKYGSDLSTAMSDLAFDDPRIAKWLSSLLAGDGEQVARIGQIAVPRLAVGGDVAGKFGVALAGDYGAAGRRWRLDARYHGNIQPIEARQFQVMDDGTVVPGIHQAQAIAEWAEDITEATLLNHRRGVKEIQKYKGSNDAGTERVARRVGEQYQPLEDGEVMDGPEDLFRVGPDGEIRGGVEFGDSAFFDHEIAEQTDELMLSAIMPFVRDRFETEAGLARLIPNQYKEGGKFWGKAKKKLDVQQDTSQFVNMRRARVSDLQLEPSSALPNVAITEKYTRQPNTMWDAIVRYGFDKVIGPAIDSLARKPMSFHYFAAAYKQQKRQLTWLLDDELFDVRIPEAFGDMISLARAEGNLDQETIDAARVVARAFGSDMDGASTNDIKRFLLTIGGDQGELEAALDVAVAGRRNKVAWARSQGAEKSERVGISMLEIEADEQFMDAAELLKERINRNALHLTVEDEIVGARTDAERIVQAYHDAVPEAVWREGRDEVLKYVENHVNGLPFKMSNKQWDALSAARANLKHINDQAAEVASLRAMENVIPFLDSHEQRTMFAEYGRNFLPFWYAEENFIKRWARTASLGQFGLPGVKHTIPSGGLDVLRKAQLTYMGIKSAGLIRTDSNGNDWVVYPGSGLLQEAVAKILPGELEPVGVLFQAETTSLLPGVTPDGNVSPSPLVAMPVHFVQHVFPDAKGVKEGILGEIGANRGIIQQFVPTALNNIWVSMLEDETSSVRYASAMNAAIAYAEANGQGLEDGASAEEIDAYLDRMRNHARIVLASQAFAGWFVPGSPNALVTGEQQLIGTGANTVDPREVTSEIYRGYIKNLGMDEGVQAFLAAFPNADLEDIVNPMAFTTSSSTAPSGAPLPATATGIEWYDRNKSWVDASPEAGAWLIPQPDVGADTEFNRNAYQSQVVSGLRKRRTPQEYLSAIKYRQGADVYFRNKDKYDEAVIRAGGNMNAKKQLDDKWAIWKGQFLAANPLFAEQLQSGDARVRRARTVEQLRYAVTDPQAPDSPYKDEIARLVRSYDSYAAKRKILGDRSDAASREKLRQLKERFQAWGDMWTLQNPNLSRLWDSVYRIQAGIA